MKVYKLQEGYVKKEDMIGGQVKKSPHLKQKD